MNKDELRQLSFDVRLIAASGRAHILTADEKKLLKVAGDYLREQSK